MLNYTYMDITHKVLPEPTDQPALRGKAIPEGEVNRIRDDAALFCALEPTRHAQPELMLQNVEFLPLDRPAGGEPIEHVPRAADGDLPGMSATM